MAEAVSIYKILNLSFLDTASASIFKISSFFPKLFFATFPAHLFYTF